MIHLQETITMRNLKNCGLTLLTFSFIVPTFAAVEDTGFSDLDTSTWYAKAVMLLSRA